MRRFLLIRTRNPDFFESTFSLKALPSLSFSWTLN